MQIIDSGHQTAQNNMLIDQELLLSLHSQKQPILRFYDWLSPSATYGYFSTPDYLLNQEAIESYGLQLAKRPTGGGIIFHDFDLTFSFLLPASHERFSINTLDNYCFVNQIVAHVIEKFISLENPSELLYQEKNRSLENDRQDPLRHFCMAKPTVYDVVNSGRKLAGAAQRRTKDGFLHQGSISLVMPPDSFLESIFSHDLSIAHAMKSSTFALLGSDCSEEKKRLAKEVLKQLLAESFFKNIYSLSASL